MTSNHTTEPSDGAIDQMAGLLLNTGRERHGLALVDLNSLDQIMQDEYRLNAADILRALSPSPDDRMGEVLRYALRPFANAAEKCRTPIAGDAAKWLAWDDFEVARNVLANTRLAASREGGENMETFAKLLADERWKAAKDMREIVGGDEIGDYATVLWKARQDIAAALASPAPMQMLVDGEWLKNKITTDPDSECEVRPAPMPEKLTVEDIERETLDLMAEASEREGVSLHQWISARIDAAALGSVQDKEGEK